MRAVVSTMKFRAGGAAAAAKEAHTVIPTTSRRVIDKAHEYLPVIVPKGARRAGAWNLRAVATTLALAATSAARLATTTGALAARLLSSRRGVEPQLRTRRWVELGLLFCVKVV